MEPPVVAFSREPEAMLVMAKAVVVALVRSVLPVRVVEAREAERLPVSAPNTVSVELAARAPPTLRTLLIVEEPVTARAVVVAPTAVSPPLKAICVEVALLGNGYANVW